MIFVFLSEQKKKTKLTLTLRRFKMTVQTLAFTIVLLLFSSFSFAQEHKRMSLTSCTCEYTFIYRYHEPPGTSSRLLYHLSEIDTQLDRFIEAYDKAADVGVANILEECSNMVFESRTRSGWTVKEEFYKISNCETEMGYQRTKDD